METNFNLGSLKTIQAPIIEYLNSAHDNISKNIEIIRDEKKMPTNHDYIKIMEKLDKTFNMIGLHSLSVIFNLNKEALIKVSEITYDTEKHLEILNAVLVILNNTKVYIKSLVNGAHYHPTKFFENYATVATLIRKDFNIKDLFNPNLELKSSIQSNIREELRRGITLNVKNRKNLLENLKVVENTYTNSLQSLIDIVDNQGIFSSKEEKEKYQAFCKNIYEKLDVAQKLKISKSHYIMLGVFKLYICILSPIFNEDFLIFIKDNAKKTKEDLSSISEVLHDLINNINNLGEDAKTGSLKVKEDIIKNIVFNILSYIKVNPALTEMSIYNELTMYFDLDYYAEQLLDTKISNSENISLNFSTVEKLFFDLKEDFTLLDNKKKSSKDSLVQHIQRLININNKLAEAVLSVKEVHVLVSQISATFSIIKSGKLVLTETIERELSIALVLVEYGVNNIIKNNVESRYKSEFGQQAQVQITRIKAAELDDKNALSILPMPRLDSASQRLDEKKSFAKIFEQISLDLVIMEEKIDNMIRNDGEDVDKTNLILKPLSEMKGILSIIQKEDLIPVLNKILEVWAIVESKGLNNWIITNDMKESIVLISGFSLFVEAFKSENDVEAEEIYENILNRFNSRLNKNNAKMIDDNAESIEVSDFTPLDMEAFTSSEIPFSDLENDTSNDISPEIIEQDKVTSIITPSYKAFSLEDDLHSTEYNSDEELSGMLNRDDIIQELSEFDNNDVNRLIFLVKSYLALSGEKKSVVSSGELLATALVNIIVNQSHENIIIVNDLKPFIKLDSLISILTGQNEFNNQVKQQIRQYLNSLPETVENNVSLDGRVIHGNIEKEICNMLNAIAVIKMPNINLSFHQDQISNDVQVKDITIPEDKKIDDFEITLSSVSEVKKYTEKSNDEDLLEFFLEEVFEILDFINVSIVKVEQNSEDIEEITNLRRYFHTLKGSGRTLGLDYWGEAAWMTEQTLNRVLCGDLTWNKELLSAIKYMRNDFKVLINELKNTNEINVDLVAIKMLWLPINEKMTHHVEIDLPQVTVDDNDFMNSMEPLELSGSDMIDLHSVEPLELSGSDMIDLHSVEQSGIHELDILPDFEISKDLNPENVNSDILESEGLYEFSLDNDLYSTNKEDDKNVVESSDIDYLSVKVEDKPTISMESFDAIVGADDNLIINLENESYLIDSETSDNENINKVEEITENILIDGKNVPLYIFNLYKDESLLHINKLKDFVNSNYGDNVEMDSNFMVHAHTLSSISKTVNLQKIARIASVLEDVAMMALEREIMLSSEDMNIIRHSVQNIELFQDFQMVADISFYETLILKLDGLYDRLTEREEENAEKEGSYIEDNNFGEESLEIKENAMVFVEKEVLERVYSQVKSDVESALESVINEKLLIAIKSISENSIEYNKQLTQTIELMKQNHSLEITNYKSDILQLTEKIVALETSNKALIKVNEETMKAIRLEIIEIKAKSNNKSGSWFSKIFG